jgi:hypothetical protein
MEHYVGLDVSLKLTAICIVDRTGKIEREGVVAFDPETITAFIKSHAPHVARVGLETGQRRQTQVLRCREGSLCAQQRDHEWLSLLHFSRPT